MSADPPVEVLDDPRSQLVRKVAWIRWVAVVETISYLLLLGFWLSGHDLGVKLVGSLHGTIWMGFVGMLFGVERPMGWTRKYLALVILTGPVGAVLVHERIRRHGVPAVLPSRRRVVAA